jgi:hypothetical protein
MLRFVEKNSELEVLECRKYCVSAKNRKGDSFNFLIFFFRWGFTPLSEAERLGHKAVSGFLQHWIFKESNGETLTAQGGKDLLQKIKAIELSTLKESPTSEQQQPKVEQQQPKGEQQQPKGEQQQPKGEQQQPKGEQQQPKVEQQRLKGEQQQTKGDQQQPKGERQPKGEQQHPKGEQQQQKRGNAQ